VEQVFSEVSLAPAFFIEGENTNKVYCKRAIGKGRTMRSRIAALLAALFLAASVLAGCGGGGEEEPAQEQQEQQEQQEGGGEQEGGEENEQEEGADIRTVSLIHPTS
jgi:hypothetical protein